MDCFNNYMGIRGECEDATLYLDDLSGIDIIKASHVVSGHTKRPIELVRKCFGQAKRDVFSDIMGQFDNYYNSLIDSKSYKYAGSEKFKGEITNDAVIKIIKTDNDKYTKVKVYDFEIVSDRDITIQFIVSDEYGIKETINYDLKYGINKIGLERYFSGEYLKIRFDASGFKIGAKSYFHNRMCLAPCQTSICIDDCSYIETSFDFGFNLSVDCISDECEIFKLMLPHLTNSLLYKTGIHYILEAKLSGNINAYLINTEDSLDEILTLWMGGFDNVSGTRVRSMYWDSVKNATNSLKGAFSKINSSIFGNNKSFSVTNNLP